MTPVSFVFSAQLRQLAGTNLKYRLHSGTDKAVLERFVATGYHTLNLHVLLKITQILIATNSAQKRELYLAREQIATWVTDNDPVIELLLTAGMCQIQVVRGRLQLTFRWREVTKYQRFVLLSS